MIRQYQFKITIAPKGMQAMELFFGTKPSTHEVLAVIRSFEETLNTKPDYSAYKRGVEKHGIPEEVGLGEPPMQVLQSRADWVAHSPVLTLPESEGYTQVQMYPVFFGEGEQLGTVIKL